MPAAAIANVLAPFPKDTYTCPRWLPEGVGPADFDGLSEGIIDHLNTHGWGSKFDFPPMATTARRYLKTYAEKREQLTRRPQDALREMYHE